MKREEERIIVLLACTVVYLGILVIDLRTPLGAAEWMLYMVPVLTAFRFLSRRQIVLLCSFGTFLMAVGFVFSPQGMAWQVALFNRVVGVGVLWLTSVFIVNRRQMEDKLRASEEKYRVLVENSPNLIAIIQDGLVKYVNRAACEVLGWTFEEMTAPSFNFLERTVAKEYRGLAKENITKRLRGEEIPPYEIRLLRRDGSEIHAIVRGQRILYEEKPAEEVLLVDITERKRMEEALKRYSEQLEQLVKERTNNFKESEAKFWGLYDSIRDAILANDVSGRIYECNKAFENLVGYSLEELRKMK